MRSYGKLHIFIDPDPTGLGADGSDSIGAMFIPALGGMNGFGMPEGIEERFGALQMDMPGGKPLAPAYCIGYRADPAYAPVNWTPSGAGNLRVFTKGGVPIDVTPRGYQGVNAAAFDARNAVTAIELSDSSVVGIRFAS